MTPQEELAALRRMAELEAKASQVEHATPQESSPGIAEPILGLGEVGLQALTGIPTLVSKGLAGAVGMYRNGRAGMSQTQDEIASAPDYTYQPRTQSGKDFSSVLSKPGEALHALAMARTQGTTEYNPLLLARGGMKVPTGETPEQAARMGAAVELLGNAIPAALGARALGRTLSAGKAGVSNWFNPEIAARDVIKNVAGTEEQRAAQAAALRSAPAPLSEAVPNSGVTAAQAVSGIPEGTTIQALQRSVAQVPDRGVSVDFARRLAQQKLSQEVALGELDAKTGPMREAALAAASARGGVPAKGLLADLAEQSSSVEAKGTPVAGKVLRDTSQFIRDNTDANGNVDPALLYQFRKTGLNQIIAQNAGTDMDALGHAKYNVAKGVQNAIDDGITRAGGIDWANYLKTYSEGRQPIEALKHSPETMYSPQQPTSVSGNAEMAAGTGAPHIFSRTASITNYGLGLRRALMSKGVNRAIADNMLDPNRLADVLTTKSAPSVMKPLDPFTISLISALRGQQDQQEQQ